MRRADCAPKVTVNSIIGVNGMGRVNPFDIVPSLSNSKLFQRDRGICGYLRRPVRQQRAGARAHRPAVARRARQLDERGLLVPAMQSAQGRADARRVRDAADLRAYIPSLWEDMILRNRTILSDQMAFLAANLPRGSRLHG
jgi:hypothetical protein